MKEYGRFFFGTPKRFLGTLGALVALLVFVRLFPGLINEAIQQLIRELAPLVGAAIEIGVLIAVLAFMLRALTGKK